jgi:hypothetical protein
MRKKILLICFMLSTITLLFNNSFKSYAEFDKKGLEQLDAEYVNWNVNVATDELPEEGNNCVIKAGNVNLLLDPFYKGTVSQNCDIKSGSSLFFPFYEGWCDSGSHDMYGEQSYQVMLDCALDSDKGIVTMSAWLDGKQIVDIKVNNVKYHTPFVIHDKFPENKYYKTIITPSFFDLTVTNKTRFGADVYEKPSDFEKSPAVYKAVAHCFCGLITNMTKGTHELRYKTIIEGSGGVEGKGWDQQTDITYKFNVLP